MTPPVACSLHSLHIAASPLKGALPAARQSRFRGSLMNRHGHVTEPSIEEMT